MAALKKLRTELVEKMSDIDMTTTDIMDFIDNFIEEEQKQYETNKENKCLTFGK